MRRAVEDLTIPIFTKLAKPDATADEFDKMDYGLALNVYLKRTHQVEQYVRDLWSVVWGQCLEVMQKQTASERDIRWTRSHF